MIQDIGPERDTKLQMIKSLWSQDIKRQKVIVFSYYRDTTRYLHRELAGERGQEFRKNAGNPVISRTDSGISPVAHARFIESFAAHAQNPPPCRHFANTLSLPTFYLQQEGQTLPVFSPSQLLASVAL